ncbi:MAG: nicotinate-nucleotide diphosphorylase, partial [Candidatus Dormibacteria bacterium]
MSRPEALAVGPELIELVSLALAEDVGGGDITTEATVPVGARTVAVITAKARGVLAGTDVAIAVFLAVDPGLECTRVRRDGDAVIAGDRVLTVAGNARAVLVAERTALNFLQRLSGIATATAAAVALVEGTGVRLLDTRKTTPGLRRLEKAAVASGGGTNHRLGLYDRFLIKE